MYIHENNANSQNKAFVPVTDTTLGRDLFAVGVDRRNIQHFLFVYISM